MAKEKAKILILVEGAKTDVRLIEHLFQVYGIDAKYEIVSYGTNIYVLYNEMFYEGKPEDMDILQVLKEREQDASKKLVFAQEYTDILLVFDIEPQDGQFSVEKISAMANYFVESTDMGKLYLSYPMIEAFYHMTNIPDAEYNSRVVTICELCEGTYKQRVNSENRNRDYRKFAATREECNIVIRQNIEKGWHILNDSSDDALPDTRSVLDKQLEFLSNEDKMYVLCTCVFFIKEYNPLLLK